jgi:hypothetical protein
MTLRPFNLFAVAACAASAFAAEPSLTPAPATRQPADKSAVVAASPAAVKPAPAPARPAASIAPTASLDEFRLITDRNIFNPNRNPRRERAPEEKPARVDTITLVGTMDSEKGLRAFFDGSESGFRKALRVGDAIDKFKVTQISPNVVQLERDGKTFAVRVGQQFRRPEGGDWNLEDAPREVPARTADQSPSSPPAIPADAPEALKRLMERRQKELKN